MKKLKKLFAVMLSLIMVLAMGITSFADTGAKPVDGDAKAVTIENVENGATIDAYQIIDATYNTEGFVGYVWSKGMNQVGKTVNAAVNAPNSEVTSALVTDLSKTDLTKLNHVGNVKSNETLLPVGTWMLIVTPPTNDPAKVYNPMVVSVYYSTTGSGDKATMESKPVNANDNWTLNETGAYAKSSDVTVTKTTKGTDEAAQVGTDVEFTITGTIPSYSSEYTSVKYDLTDTLTRGLVFNGGTADNILPKDLSVKVGGADVDASKYDVKNNDATHFTVSFHSDYILSLVKASAEQRAVTITYKAQVTTDAITGYAQNDVTLNYTNKPGENNGSKTDTSYVSTVELDGVLQKVKANQTESLPGAEFTLYHGNDIVASYTTGGDGDIEFKGLDADEEYTLKETKAPTGYSLNNTVYTIKFTDVVKDETTKKITSYKVVISYQNADGQTVTETSGTINIHVASEVPTVKIVNTQLSELPATGGVGTTIFTIVGCGIMIAAAGLFFASRRKENR